MVDVAAQCAPEHFVTRRRCACTAGVLTGAISLSKTVRESLLLEIGDCRLFLSIITVSDKCYGARKVQAQCLRQRKTFFNDMGMAARRRLVKVLSH